MIEILSQERWVLMTPQNQARIHLFISMFVFGTIGLFVSGIPLPSSVIALARGIIGTTFLYFFMRYKGLSLDWKAIKFNALLLLFSGLFIGLNWAFLFEAYQYTSVSTATLFYYMAPIFVMIASPLILKEPLSLKNSFSITVALIGMFFVSGVVQHGFEGVHDWRGIFFGILASIFYAAVQILNQFFKDIDAYNRTIVQLFFASITMLPYVAINVDLQSLEWTTQGIILLLIVGTVHTGLTYALYFGSMIDLNAQTVALYSYIDPIVAIISSAIILREPMGPYEIIGAVLILGSTLINEWLSIRRKRTLQ